ncbi:MAG: DAK2 domain-containing protein [Acidimicrobiales bacterium]
MSTALGAAELGAVMRSFEGALERQKDLINKLNVYPVPDGDTGTNMHLTLESVSRQLASVPDDDMAATCMAISHGSLMGARGNSGVILCQILRGLTASFVASVAAGPAPSPPAGSTATQTPRAEISAGALAAALAEANSAAHSAVMRPVEGTILSVIKAAAEAAAELTGSSGTAPPGTAPPGTHLETEPAINAVAEAARAAAVEALWHTPEQLPVLADAGVVDAGGAGLVLLFDALLEVLDGRPVPDQIPLPDGVLDRVGSGVRAAAVSSTGVRGLAADDIADLRYEVMYFLEAADHAIPAFKSVWAGLGDSIVVVGGEGTWNCHIHTNDIGAALEAALDAGRPRNIRVTDLLEQVEEESWVRRAVESTSGGEPEELEVGPPPTTSVVSVATGTGIGRIFHSLGALHIVAGGQSMNPSTEQILTVIETTPGAEVVVLPNNKNIFAVAAQACELATKPARVVNTPGIQEGFAALLEYDPQAGADENASSMTAAAARVAAGEVTQAVRASSTEAGAVAEGDWIGISRRGIEVVAKSVSEVTIRLIDELLDDSCEIVTIIEGVAAKAADTRHITEWLAETHPGVSVELHHGGQALYPYLISVE